MFAITQIFVEFKNVISPIYPQTVKHLQNLKCVAQNCPRLDSVYRFAGMDSIYTCIYILVSNM